jgi:hypothetical protein
MKPKKSNQIQTEKNKAKSVWPVSVFLYFKFGLVIFFDKNQIEQKIIIPT